MPPPPTRTLRPPHDPAGVALLVVLGAASAGALLLLQRGLGRGSSSSSTSLSLPPSERGLPFFGVALSFFKDVNGFLAARRRKHTRRPPPSEAEAEAEAVVGPFRFYLMGRWWTMVHELADVRTVLTTRESELSFLGGFGDLIKGLLPEAFTFVPRNHVFVPMLRSANLLVYLEAMVGEARPLLARLLQESRGEDDRVDLFDVARRVVMHMNLLALFGPAVFEHGRADAYQDAFAAIDPEGGLVNVFSALLRPSQKEAMYRTIGRVTKDMLAHYEAKVEAERQEGEGGDEIGAVECALHFLVRQAADNGKPLNAEETTGDLFAVVFASFTNTFAVTGWCVWELAGDAALCGRYNRLEISMDEQSRAANSS